MAIFALGCTIEPMSHLLNEAISIGDIKAWTKAEGVGVRDTDKIAGVFDFSRSEPSCLGAYIKGKHPENKEGLTVLCKEPIPGYRCLVVAHPQLAMNRLLARLQVEPGFQKRCDSPRIHPSVKLGQQVIIEDNVEIGENTVIEHRATIYAGTRIGKNCLIRAHAVIGTQGYTFFRDEHNQLHKQISIGGVDIGDNVEIGANVCIGRGTVFDTTLRQGVKVDNLVQIGHDSFIDEEAYVIASASVSGYVTVGELARIAPGACIKQNVKIGRAATVGMGSVVVRDVKAESVVFGAPAEPIWARLKRKPA